MSSRYSVLAGELRAAPKRWCVTGCAGFIGSHLTARLLELGQEVVGLDSFATGYEHNLQLIQQEVGENYKRFTFVKGDIADLDSCRKSVAGVDYVLHQAALGSVPRSIDDPLSSHRANVDGFVNMLIAARDSGVSRFVYASSSSVYGDLEESPKREKNIGECLSPYAVTKRVNELYANNFSDVYGLAVSGLRYFNVFGPRQDPNGAYAAVIPKWIDTLVRGEQCVINGDGETSRDFCYVENVVQANILAACTVTPKHGVYNIALGGSTSLNDLYRMIRGALAAQQGRELTLQPRYQDFRTGDVRHSLADVSLAVKDIGFSPAVFVEEGLVRTVKWFAK